MCSLPIDTIIALLQLKNYSKINISCYSSEVDGYDNYNPSLLNKQMGLK